MNSQRSINLLIETMIRLMKSKQFSDITITELTREAGLVRNTFYAHFESKEDVLSYHMYETFRQGIQASKSEMLEERWILTSCTSKSGVRIWTS